MNIKLVDAKTGVKITTAEEARDYYSFISGEDKYIGSLAYAEKHPDEKLPPLRVTLAEFIDTEELKTTYFSFNAKNPKKLPPKIKNVYLDSVKSLVVKRFLIYIDAGYAEETAKLLTIPEPTTEDEIQNELVGLSKKVDEKFTDTTYMENMTLVHSVCMLTFSNNGKITSILKGKVIWEWISNKLKTASSQSDEAKKLADFFKKMLSSDAKSIEFAKADGSKKKNEVIHEKLDELYDNLK